MNILILDDVRLVRETVKESLSNLKEWDLNIREASNGFDALDMVGRYPLDVVLVDIKMPKMNGLDFIKKASRINNALHFIILSSFSEFEYARSALKMGVSDYLLKPVSDEELFSVLSRIKSEMESEDQQRLVRMEKSLNNFLNHPVRDNLPENAFFFCFHPKAGVNIDSTFYKRINQLSDDLSLRLNAMGISNIIRSGENQWQCLLFADSDQYRIIHREVRAVSKLLESIHFLSLDPQKLQLTDCFSEHRSLFFRNITAMALVAESAAIAGNTHRFSAVMDLLRNIGDSLTAITKGIYTPWRSFDNSLVKTIDDLNDFSSDAVTILLDHLLDLFSIGTNESEDENRISVIERIEAEYMRLQFNRDVPFPGNVIAYVQNNYMYPINIAEIAGHLCKTPNALSAAFKKATGQTLNRYITSVRMKKAEKLLLTTELTSKQIGEMVGMADSGYFCKVFKDIMGLSPMDYRKSNTSGH